jgi:hypothetical protein
MLLQEGRFSTQGSRRAPFTRSARRRSIQTHLSILRPEGLDPLGHITIVDIAAVDLEEIA